VASFSRKPQGKDRERLKEGFCGTEKSHISKEDSAFETGNIEWVLPKEKTLMAKEKQREEPVPLLIHLDTFSGGVNIILSKEERIAFQKGTLSRSDLISMHLGGRFFR
jgi:hypothetical protein